MPTVKILLLKYSLKILFTPLYPRAKISPRYKKTHMELAEWLVRRTTELVSQVRYSARSSSMMHILHLHKNQRCNYVAENKKIKQ